MKLSRRGLIKGLGTAPLASGLLGSGAVAGVVGSSAIALPDRANFVFDGIDLNAAFTHMIGRQTNLATQDYVHKRMIDPSLEWPSPKVNQRDEAVALYARIINADPGEIAIVPSTLEGENLIAAALRLGPGRGVVSDQLHYDASLAMYGERHKRGMPLTILKPRDWKIDYDELERAITPETKLVAVSLVSSPTGYKHDLKRVCDIAHAKGALVYADVIQAVGAIPVDVKESGVDFCCAGMYKWLMGEFGAAFLYVRADRLPQLERVQLGWRGMTSFHMLQLPYDPPAPPGGDWQLGTDTASIFEVSTPNWGGIATTVGSLDYILRIGVDAIARHRQPMLDRLQHGMLKADYQLLTPPGYQGPSLVFAKKGIGSRYRDALKQARIFTTLYENRIRVAPSVHNDVADIDRLLSIVAAKA